MYSLPDCLSYFIQDSKLKILSDWFYLSKWLQCILDCRAPFYKRSTLIPAVLSRLFHLYKGGNNCSHFCRTCYVWQYPTWCCRSHDQTASNSFEALLSWYIIYIQYTLCTIYTMYNVHNCLKVRFTPRICFLTAWYNYKYL